MKLLSLLFTIICINSAAAKTVDLELIQVNHNIELTQLNKNIYIHTSWFDFPGSGRFPSNGLIFIKNGKALLIDTPNTNEQTLELYHFLQNHLKAEISQIIVGHSHSDCMGGLSALHNKGVGSIAFSKTVEICRSQNLPIPKKSFSNHISLNFEGETIECRYFGPGHTVDNIVVYFPASQILFGGCLIKGARSKGLGNIREADTENWDKTVLNIKKAYPSIKLVVPGHGTFGNADLLDHTIALVKNYKQKTK